MSLAETSLSAYADLQPTLTDRQGLVLRALAGYYRTHRSWPTSYELFDAMHRANLVHDLNDVRPRLTELRERGKIYNPDLKRICSVTQKRAFCWQIPEKLF